MSGPVDVVRAGPPAWALAVAVPVVAIGGILWRGVEPAPGDPVPPVLVAVATVLLAFGLSVRALTQRTELGAERLRCRNLVVTYDVPWSAVEALEVQRRAGLVQVLVRIDGLRRPHRLGALTRTAGPEADATLDRLRAHPEAGPLLVEP